MRVQLKFPILLVLLIDSILLVSPGQRCLLYFDPEDDEKIIIFSSDAHLNLLMRGKHRLMDVTFKSSPKRLCQIYAIHVQAHEIWVPVVIALLERKTKRTYENVVGVLKNTVQEKFNRHLSPLRVSTDFEQAAISAVTSAFPGSKPSGCLFHFSQALWRRVQAEGLSEVYRREESEDMRSDFHSLIGRQ